MMQEHDPMERDTQAEEDAAAAEGGAVGGRSDPSEDPERAPVDEAGGGESEGFEQAEDDLREHAEHGEPGGDPSREAFTPEEESDRETGAARGEPDEPGASERTGEP